MLFKIVAALFAALVIKTITLSKVEFKKTHKQLIVLLIKPMSKTMSNGVKWGKG